MSVPTTLTALGGDLTLSISWAIGNELLAAAKDIGLRESELIGAVLCLSIVLSGLPELVLAVVKESRRVLQEKPRIADPCDAPQEAPQESRGVTAFVGLYIRIAQRISTSICVQLVATSVHTQQPVRAVRVITLLGVAVFFVFLESSSSLGRFA